VLRQAIALEPRYGLDGDLTVRLAALLHDIGKPKTRALLPDGRVARYYELKTNKPLYMDAAYRLTYDDSAAPAHYGWKQPARFAVIEKAYTATRDGTTVPEPKKSAAELEPEVRWMVKELDADGRWVSTYTGERLVGQPKFAPGFRYLSSDVFSRNVETLIAYLEATAR
jgi:hypothetical protein